MPRKARSQAQARLFGAIAGGHARKKTGLSKAKAKKMVQGTKVSKLPKKVKRKAKKK